LIFPSERTNNTYFMGSLSKDNGAILNVMLGRARKRRDMKTIILVWVMAILTTVHAQQTNILDKVQQAFEVRQQATLAQYRKTLGAIMEDAKKDGDLDKLLLLQAEQKRFDAEKTVPPPAEAKAEFLSASKAHTRAMTSLLKQYVEALDDLVKKQVRAARIEEAKVFKAEKDRVSALLAEMQTLSPSKEADIPSREPPQPVKSKKWDVAKDFSNSENPSGAWSYGVLAKPGANLVLFRKNAGVWADGGANIWINNAEVSRYGIGPGQVSIHPGPNGEYGVIRWTCAHLKSGLSERLTVKGTFGAGDSGKMTVGIFHNGKKLFSVSNTPRDEPFSLDVKVQPKDTIDFTVSPGAAGWGCGNTPLDLLITSK
jgi:hypothetical protein